MKIYLDIDGTIIDEGGWPAAHLDEFLEYVTSSHDTYWLSTQCRGDVNVTMAYLRKFLPPATLELCERVKPTNWHRWKTEVLSFRDEFYWMSDKLEDHEWQFLKRVGFLDRWIPVDLSGDANALLHAMKKIKETYGNHTN